MFDSSDMSEIKMVVGLGNPGTEYVNTRHNVGFKVIDLLAKNLGVDVKKRKFSARFGAAGYAEKRIILLKPWQFMNLSGQAVATAVGFYKLDLSELLVVLDDMWLEPGRIRLRTAGSAGGHNGLADVIEKLNTEKFSRLRIGVGRSEPQDAYDYVLSEPTEQQKPLIEKAIENAKDAVVCWLECGIEKAMNEFNSI